MAGTAFAQRPANIAATTWTADERGCRNARDQGCRALHHLLIRIAASRLYASLDGRKLCTQDRVVPDALRLLLAAAICLYVLGGLSAPIVAQRAGAFRGSTEDPAIKYSSTPLNNAVVEANRKIQDGSLRLSFEGRSGFLRSALDALQIPVDSQLLVFSRASLQGKLINERNPRALFFNDRVALGWVRGGEIIEVAAHDESAGVVFYTLDQRDAAALAAVQASLRMPGMSPGGDTLGVPGFLMFSTTRPAQSQEFSLPRAVDHSDALSRRFGGWFVTGSTGSAPAHGKRHAFAGWTREPRAHVGRGIVRRGWLSRPLERHRRSPGLHASDRHGQSPHARELAGARRRSVAPPTIYCDAR